MNSYTRFYFAGCLMFVLLFNTACGKKSDLTLPEEPTTETDKTAQMHSLPTPSQPSLHAV